MNSCLHCVPKFNNISYCINKDNKIKNSILIVNFTICTTDMGLKTKLKGLFA